MKFIYLALFCFSISAAISQPLPGESPNAPPPNLKQRLWTWNAPYTPNMRFIVSAAMNPDGSGAFVLQEKLMHEAAFYNIVWLTSRGQELASQIMLGSETERWELVFAGPSKMVASNGKIMLIFTASRGKATITQAIYQRDTLLFGAPPSFAGWLTHSGELKTIPYVEGAGSPGSPGYIPGSEYQQFRNADTISAWRF